MLLPDLNKGTMLVLIIHRVLVLFSQYYSSIAHTLRKNFLLNFFSGNKMQFHARNKPEYNVALLLYCHHSVLLVPPNSCTLNISTGELV